MKNDRQLVGMTSEDISYVETPNEAVARHLDMAISSKALALQCMEKETELRKELFHIGEELCQQRITICGIPKREGINFGKLPAK